MYIHFNTYISILITKAHNISISHSSRTRWSRCLSSTRTLSLYTYVHTHIYIYIYMCMYTYIYIYVYIHMYIYVYIWIWTRIYVISRILEESRYEESMHIYIYIYMRIRVIFRIFEKARHHVEDRMHISKRIFEFSRAFLAGVETPRPGQDAVVFIWIWLRIYVISRVQVCAERVSMCVPAFFSSQEAKHHVEDRMRDCYIQDHTSDWAFSAPREQ